MGAADSILRSLTSRVSEMRLVLANPTPETLDAALTVGARYQPLDLDLADAMNAALAAEYTSRRTEDGHPPARPAHDAAGALSRRWHG
ncbi:hypothetical protein ACFWN1_02010 [Streptomyces sp. NPDC058459]|uniref:hypothetical protein n=1 Tax=Streptomyces sp. NPDC058459 TaxID=3346508 RepID=UPI003668133E